jgi:hypothetical protein
MDFVALPISVAKHPMSVLHLFESCVQAIKKGTLIRRVSRADKEFHFQNWFKARLESTGLNFEIGGRNSYPDFRMVASTEGYELKALAYPGRDADFDSNSQAPTGFHNGRTIYYVFGRYPKKPDGLSYPVLDLVICHGDFLNADHEYRHKNKSVKGFGTYGDILIRDRKMYVVPTPFRLLEGAAHHRTLILPVEVKPGKGFFCVGALSRVESPELIIGYAFDLKNNEIVAKHIPNPGAGKKHDFRAWRLKGDPQTDVTLRPKSEATPEIPAEDENAKD